MDENRLIAIEDLQIGDEVLVAGNDLRYFKILRLPKKRTKANSWGVIRGFSSIKCGEFVDIENLSSPTREVYFDFSYKSIWLVKRI